MATNAINNIRNFAALAKALGVHPSVVEEIGERDLRTVVRTTRSGFVLNQIGMLCLETLGGNKARFKVASDKAHYRLLSRYRHSVNENAYHEYTEALRRALIEQIGGIRE